jgi:hypothetical protein
MRLQAGVGRVHHARQDVVQDAPESCKKSAGADEMQVVDSNTQLRDDDHR